MTMTIPILSKLFRGISPEDGARLMNELSASLRRIPKGRYVLREGDLKRNIGILLDGRLEMFETDPDGRRSMVGVVHPPESFALVFAFAAVERHPASVLASDDSTILVIPVDRILPQPGTEIDPVRRRFIRNILAETSEQAWELRSRAFILSRRSTSERLLTYLRQQMRSQGSASFSIPFDRQGLADFLCVDRSALSSVLGRLAKRGLLAYHKNSFVLKGAAGGME